MNRRQGLSRAQAVPSLLKSFNGKTKPTFKEDIDVNAPPLSSDDEDEAALLAPPDASRSDDDAPSRSADIAPTSFTNRRTNARASARVAAGWGGRDSQAKGKAANDLAGKRKRPQVEAIEDVPEQPRLKETHLSKTTSAQKEDGLGIYIATRPDVEYPFSRNSRPGQKTFSKKDRPRPQRPQKAAPTTPILSPPSKFKVPTPISPSPIAKGGPTTRSARFARPASPGFGDSLSPITPPVKKGWAPRFKRPPAMTPSPVKPKSVFKVPDVDFSINTEEEEDAVVISSDETAESAPPLSQEDEDDKSGEGRPCPACRVIVDVAFLRGYMGGIYISEVYMKSMSPKQEECFCRGHKRHTAEAAWEERGYPTIDWVALPSRIEAYKADLMRVLENKSGGGKGKRTGNEDDGPSVYRRMLEQKVSGRQDRTIRHTAGVIALSEFRAEPVRSRKAASAAEDDLDGRSTRSRSEGGDDTTSNVTVTAGYYGHRGRRLMAEAITDKFSALLRKLAVEDKLISSRGSTVFVDQVLVPELAVRLVMEDMGLRTQEEAREVLANSAEVGDVLNEEVGDVVEDDNAEDVIDDDIFDDDSGSDSDES